MQRNSTLVSVGRLSEVWREVSIICAEGSMQGIGGLYDSVEMLSQLYREGPLK